MAADLKMLIETANAPIFGIDGDGKVNEWNRKAREITGYPKEEVVGRSLVQDFITAEFQASVKEVLDNVVNDLTAAHFWDISAVGSIDKAILKFSREGTHVEVIGLNQASATMVDRFAVHDKPGAEAALGAH